MTHKLSPMYGIPESSVNLIFFLIELFAWIGPNFLLFPIVTTHLTDLPHLVYSSRQWKIQLPPATGYAAGLFRQCLRLHLNVVRPAVGGVRPAAYHARQGPTQLDVFCW